MKSQLLDIIGCPSCHSDLDLEISEGDQSHIVSGVLVCKNCNGSYQIYDDIPYFASDIEHAGVKNQFETYSHWFEEMHDEDSIIDPIHKNYFKNSLRIEEEEFRDKVVLDGGCGNGRFSYIVSKYSPKLLISFDISNGLGKAKETILKHNPDANIAFVQGDITRPPFKKEVFDIIYSWGVTHHTPNTKKTIETLSSLVKEKGIFGIYVYVFNPDYQYDKQILGLLAYVRSFFITRPFRFICSRLPVSIVKLIFKPIYYTERFFNFGIFGCHDSGPYPFKDKDRYFRVVVDRFKTRYASEHTREEIFKWFFDLGFNDLRVGNPRVSVTGLKTKESASNKNVIFFD